MVCGSYHSNFADGSTFEKALLSLYSSTFWEQRFPPIRRQIQGWILNLKSLLHPSIFLLPYTIYLDLLFLQTHEIIVKSNPMANGQAKFLTNFSLSHSQFQSINHLSFSAIEDQYLVHRSNFWRCHCCQALVILTGQSKHLQSVIQSRLAFLRRYFLLTFSAFYTGNRLCH